MQFQLDVNSTTVALNSTNFADGPKLLWNADNLGDGDHQLFVFINGPLQQQENGTVWVDYFEYVVPLLHLVTKIVF